MTDLTDINYDDALLFLQNNNEKIPSNVEGVYYKVWLLIKKGANYYPNSVIEWITADNFIISNKDQYDRLPYYKISVINRLSKVKLQEIGQSLGLNNYYDRELIIRMLKYLHKLKDPGWGFKANFDDLYRRYTMEQILREYNDRMYHNLFKNEKYNSKYN